MSDATQVIPLWPHPHRLSYRTAVAIQRRLAGCVIATDRARQIRYVAGLDAAFADEGRQCLAAAVLWDLESAVALEKSEAVRRVGMPYLPGLLTFREGPALLAALRGLRTLPDALLCDGQGIAHMRRFGVASHLGVLCDLPSIGCAKSRLIGIHDERPGDCGVGLAHEGRRPAGLREHWTSRQPGAGSGAGDAVFVPTDTGADPAGGHCGGYDEEGSLRLRRMPHKLEERASRESAILNPPLERRPRGNSALHPEIAPGIALAFFRGGGEEPLDSLGNAGAGALGAFDFATVVILDGHDEVKFLFAGVAEIGVGRHGKMLRSALVGRQVWIIAAGRSG
jgi:deoxyinosine 3'endonuclease (endonuclease V)